MPQRRLSVVLVLSILSVFAATAIWQAPAFNGSSSDGTWLAGTSRYHTRQRSPAFYYRTTKEYQRTGRLPPEMQRALR